MLTIPSDLQLSRYCLSSETDGSGFDFWHDGSKTGVCFGIIGNIVCFRGSKVLLDWIRDAQAALQPVAGLGRVHSGAWLGMPQTIDYLASVMPPDAVFTGHSLGAMHAAQAAAYMGFSKLTLFGSPRPGDQEFANLFAGKQVTSYKNLNDPVTDLPLPLPPEFPYVHIAPFIQLSALVDTSLGAPWDDHHQVNYVAGVDAWLKTNNTPAAGNASAS